MFFLSYSFLYLFVQIPREIGIAVRKRSSEIDNGRSKYLWIGLLLISAGLLLVYLLSILVQPVLNEYSSVKIPTSTLISLLLASTGFGTLELSRYYLAGCGDPYRAEKLRTGIAKTSISIATFAILTYNPTVEYALIAVFLTYFTTSIIIFYKSPHAWIKPTLEEIYDILQYSKWSLSTSILNDFYRRWDTILLGVLVGSAALSYYDSSLRIAFLATTFAVGISKTSNVKMSGMMELNQDITDVAEKTIVASTYLIFPLLLIVIFNGEYILRTLFGSEYVAGYPYLVLIAVVQIFQTYRVQFESIFNSADKPGITTRASLICVAVNVVIAPLFVIQFGGLGVLYSTILSEFFRLGVYQYQVGSLLEEYIIPRGAILQYLSFTIFALILYFITYATSLTPALYLIFSSIIGTGAFCIIQYGISSETRDILSEFRSEE